jgi:arylsulfatase A-like enzyme
MKLPLLLPVLLLLFANFASGADPPNVLIILSDDQAYTDYSFMGHEAIKTPHLDRLAREGACFRRGYVPTALCRPSLATLVTGHYTHTHKISGNDPSQRDTKPGSPLYRQRRAELIAHIDRFDTLPDLLAERGYLSHQSGKWWEGHYSRGGFTHGMTQGFPNPNGRHGDEGLKIGRQGLGAVFEFVEMATQQKKPFFLWYAPFLPHQPHTPPERLLAKYLVPGRSEHVARYYAMCEWFDETCGELIGYLDKQGLRENTLIIYVTDNGWIQDPDSPTYAPRSKQTPYEGGIRTPIIFNWPGKIPATERAELCSSIDIMPTVLAATGAKVPEGLPGLNLLPHLTEGTPIERNTLFGEQYAHDVADINNPEASLLYRWVIEDNWKLLLHYDGELGTHAEAHSNIERRPQLFNLETDPHEKQNMAGRHPQIVARLSKRIAEWYPVTERTVITDYKEE